MNYNVLEETDDVVFSMKTKAGLTAEIHQAVTFDLWSVKRHL